MDSEEAATKRTKFRKAKNTTNATASSSWSSGSGITGAQQHSLIASLLAELSSEVIFEEDKLHHSCVPVRAASIRALVRLCVQSFDSKKIRDDLSAFPRTLFLMHRWFISSPQLAFLLTSCWESSSETAQFVHRSSSSSSSDSVQAHPLPKDQKRAQVVQALHYWITHFPMHFALDERLQESITCFRNRLSPEEKALLDLSDLPNYDWMRNISMRGDGEGNLRPARKVSLVFNHLEPNELALHLTFLEHKIIRRITFEDLRNYAESGTLEEVPKLERSVNLFNGLSQWIQCVVLSRHTPAQRADVIVKFVHVAQYLRKLQNFNGLMGVVGSLSHSALARLTKTMDCVPLDEKKILKELTTMVSSTSNFSAYRRALTEAKGFKIPILGVHLKDLISLHTALPDYVEGGLINFRKMSQLSGIFAELDNLAQCMPPAQANLDLLNTLRASLDIAYSEDEIYELSLAREPRTSVSPTRSPVENDQQHLQSMVDAVFKNYDLNHDGFLSKEEFQQISAQHPAIDSFFVLDENRDGMISKLEMEKYLRNKKNQRHNFHEQTYFKPTFCIHCSGLLWGLIRQGYKCRNCGVNAHKYCKEYMLYECKSSISGLRKGQFRLRKKSQSSESGSPTSPKLFTSLEQLSLSIENPSPQDNIRIPVPKSPRRLSSASPIRRLSTSVPSSPKLGSFSLWSPSSSKHSTSSSEAGPPPPSPGPSFVARAGQGLGKLFGSPQLKHRNNKVPSADHT